MKSLQLTVLTIAVSSLVACSGKGVDASLNLSSMEEFQKSYAIASKDMTQEQKDSFEWAVSNISLAQVSAKYGRPTVRAIVQGEADEFIKAHQKIIDKQKEIMASKHDFANKRIYSKDLETFEQHEEKIQDSMSEIKVAERYKATVL